MLVKVLHEVLLGFQLPLQLFGLNKLEVPLLGFFNLAAFHVGYFHTIIKLFWRSTLKGDKRLLNSGIVRFFELIKSQFDQKT